MPERIRLQRTKGWRLPPGAVSVARPTRWGNPFAYRTERALARVPAALSDAPWEYEGRISADGTRHDYFHPDGRVTVCHVRYMTRAEVVECYRRLLLGNLTEAMRMTLGGWRLPFTVADVRRELAGKSLACWCPPGEPCHADVLLAIANPKPEPHDILPRRWTPEVLNPDGSRTLTVKRCCNGCGERIGDVTFIEIQIAIDGGQLPDVRMECPRCRPSMDPPLPEATAAVLAQLEAQHG